MTIIGLPNFLRSEEIKTQEIIYHFTALISFLILFKPHLDLKSALFIPTVSFVYRKKATPVDEDFERLEARYNIRFVLLTMVGSFLYKVTSSDQMFANYLDPYPETTFDNLVRSVLLWRQWIYTLSPLIQILLNEHYRTVPNICFPAQAMKAGVVITQLVLWVLGYSRYGPYLRLSVFVRDGLLNAILFMQLRWYRYGVLHRMRQKNK